MTYSQIKVSPGQLCDDGNSYKGKSIKFTYLYTAADQPGDKWSLRSQGQDYERINSSLNYGFTSENDTYYTRMMWADCKLILRIPYNITVPNTTGSYINITGKVSAVGKTYVAIEVTEITRMQ